MIYVGEAIRIRVEANDPDSGEPLDDVTAVFLEFWEPGKNPAREPSVRGNPDVARDSSAIREEYRPDEGDYLFWVDTEGWKPGKWSFRATVQGDLYTNWEYSSFTLRE